MSVFPEEVNKADELSRREEHLQKYRSQLIEQSLLLQTSNLRDRLNKRKTRSITHSFVKNSFVRPSIGQESVEGDSFSTRSALLTSQLLEDEPGVKPFLNEEAQFKQD